MKKGRQDRIAETLTLRLRIQQKRGRDWNKITTLIITVSLSRQGILQDATTHFSILRVFSLKLIPILNSLRPSASKGSA